MSVIAWLAWIGFGFACGAVPFGVLLARLKGVNLRDVGSGNTGATNVGRALGREWGGLCFLLDAAKGALPVLVSGAVMGVLGRGTDAGTAIAEWGWMLVAIAAILGHVFSPFLNFKGGKGVATACGALLALYPVMTFPVLIGGALFLVVVLATGYMSLASMVAACSIPLTGGLIGSVELAVGDGSISTLMPRILTGILIAFTVVWRHRGNLKRIREGNEPRVFARGRMPSTTEDARGEQTSNPDTTSTNHH